MASGDAVQSLCTNILSELKQAFPTESCVLDCFRVYQNLIELTQYDKLVSPSVVMCLRNLVRLGVVHERLTDGIEAYTIGLTNLKDTIHKIYATQQATLEQLIAEEREYQLQCIACYQKVRDGHDTLQRKGALYCRRCEGELHAIDYKNLDAKKIIEEKILAQRFLPLMKTLNSEAFQQLRLRPLPLLQESPNVRIDFGRSIKYPLYEPGVPKEVLFHQ